MIRAMIRRLAVVALLALVTACGGGEPSADTTDDSATEQPTSEAPSETTTSAPTEAAVDTDEVCGLLKEVDRQDRETDRVLNEALQPVQAAKTPEQARKAVAEFIEVLKRHSKVALKEATPTYDQLEQAVPQRLKPDVVVVQEFSESVIRELGRVETLKDLERWLSGARGGMKELQAASGRLDEYSVDTCGFSIAPK